MVPSTPNKIIIHHTAVTSDHDQFNGVEKNHQERGFTQSSLGYFCGYHYLIESTGKIVQARRENEEGVHTIGGNENSIAISMSGNFDETDPTEEQKAALRRLLASVMTYWQIPPTQIFDHREFQPKSCPGARLPQKYGKLLLSLAKTELLVNTLLWISEITKE